MSNIKTTAREMFDEFYGKSWKELCEEYGNPPKVELRNYLKSFIDQIIDLAIAEERKRVVEIIKNTIGINTNTKDSNIEMQKVFNDGGLRDFVDIKEYINKVELIKRLTNTNQ